MSNHMDWHGVGIPVVTHAGAVDCVPNAFRQFSFLLLLCCTLVPGRSTAASFELNEYVPAGEKTIKELAPDYARAFAPSDFFVTGFSSVNGWWKFIRAEHDTFCKGDVCPTLIIHDAIDWKLLVLGAKKIQVSANTLRGENIELVIQSTDQKQVVIRYIGSDKIIYLMP